MQSVSYAAPKFAKERGCRTIVLVPDEYETRIGLAHGTEPILVPALVAVRTRESPTRGSGIHRYHFPLFYERLMLNSLINGYPQAPLSIFQEFKKDYPQMVPSADTIDEADNDEQIKELSDPFLFGKDVLSASLAENYDIYNVFIGGGHLNVQSCGSKLQYLKLLERFIHYLFIQVVSRFESSLIELQELTGAFKVNQEPKGAEQSDGFGTLGSATGSTGPIAAPVITPHNPDVVDGGGEGEVQEVKQEKKARPKTKRPCVQITKDDTIVADTDIPIYQSESELRQVTAATSNLFGTNARSLLPTRERLQLFHKRRRLNYLAAPYAPEQYTIAIVLPDTVTRAELSIWTELIYNRLGFSGAFISTATPMASSFSSASCMTLSATASFSRACIADPSNFSLNNTYAPLTICGNVILGTVAGVLYSLVEIGRRKTPSIDTAESMSNLLALHDFLHLYLLRKENALLYFQGAYAQLLERLILPDKSLLTQYFDYKSNCSPEDFNCFAENVIKHVLFNSGHVLFNLLRNNGLSYTALTTQSDDDVQAPVISLVQGYPQRFLSILLRRQSEQYGEDNETFKNGKDDSSVSRDRCVSVAQSRPIFTCLTVSLGYVGLVAAVCLLNNWLFETPKPHFPVLYASQPISTELERFLVDDTNFSLRTLSPNEHLQNLNVSRLLDIDSSACIGQFSFPFDTVKKEVIDIYQKILATDPSAGVSVNAVLATKYGAPDTLSRVRSVLFAIFMHLLRLSYLVDSMLNKEEAKGKGGQSVTSVSAKDVPPDELETSDTIKEPAVKNIVSASGSVKGGKSQGGTIGANFNSKVASVLQIFKSIVTTGILVYLPGLVEYIGQSFLKEENYPELLELGVKRDDIMIRSASLDWLDQNFRIGPDRTASLEWLGGAWSALCDAGIECYVTSEEFRAYGIRVFMERALFFYP
ncbi:Hypothetical protein GLP15_1269 [Giardia lamblia P15]|uniref:Uncharacterized protein n=1 Tax=Giardia intestinalis (strain P15) TaxID=658858 RepID=E1EZP4_GIAIA|nr:Hypothetical protein GLP15_1269 [Giardia lamblia P15]